ncbi:MAG: hypothetical protein RLZZ162_1146, partial [Verrucomicrobiota bacterium]
GEREGRRDGEGGTERGGDGERGRGGDGEIKGGSNGEDGVEFCGEFLEIGLVGEAVGAPLLGN